VMEDGCNMVKENGNMSKLGKTHWYQWLLEFDPLSCYFYACLECFAIWSITNFLLFLTRFSSRVSTPMTEHRLVIEFLYSA